MLIAIILSVFSFGICVPSAVSCLSTYGFICFLPKFSWLHLFLPSVPSIASSILCGAGLVDNNSFSLFSSWKGFLSPTTASFF